MSETTVTYTAFRGLFNVISHVFFREIKTSDVHLVPPSGPCIFIVGPHANQFIDGVVFLSKCPRPSYALMAAISYDKPLIGHVGKILNAIPVVRPQDIVNKGTGKIIYDPNQPFKVTGENTRFLSELEVRDFIIFGRNYKLHVSRVLSDTLLEVTHAIHIPLTYEPYSFKIAPHVDQTAVYDEVHHHLNKGECITIFPEGGSHDRSEMLPLKAGFAVMALGAIAANPDLDIKIVPVGLNYFHPDRFRSRAVVSFGQPLTIDPSDIEKYKQGGKEKREVITKLLDTSDEAFKTVTVNAPDYDTLMVIQAARRLYVPDTTRLTIEQVVKLNSHFVSLWSKLKGQPSLHTIVRKIKSYNDMLTFFGIRDHQVDKLNITPIKASILLMKRLCKLIIMAGLGAPSFLLNLPLIWITTYISKKKQKQAMAGSSVKIEGKDVLATWKVIVAAFAAPTLYAIYAFIYLAHISKRSPFISLKSRLHQTILVWAIQPILHYLLLRLGDSGLDIYKSIKPLFLAIRNPEAGSIIQSMRKDLSQDITRFITEHAPQLDLDYKSGSSSEQTSPQPNHLVLLDSDEEVNPLSDDDTSLLNASMLTSGEMPASFIVSRQESESSFIDYSTEDEVGDSIHHVEHILLES